MNFKYIIAITLAAAFFSSCEKIAMKPKPETDALAIFQEYDKLVTEKYAMLEFKGVDIDFLTDSLEMAMGDNPTEVDAVISIATIVERLRDGHSFFFATLEDGQEVGQGFDTSAGYPTAFDSTILYTNYITPAMMKSVESSEGSESDSGENYLIYGKLTQDNQIGYMRIPSFDVGISDEELEAAFTEIKDTKGLILDVRGNGGGDPSLATKIASYFMSETTYTGFERFKTGPGADDFSDSPSNVTPAESENRYVNKVAVLTDRGVYSATTTLSYNMNPLDQVVFVGQRTGGGSGSVADGYLANGWQWSLSTSEFIDHEGRHLDDGIDPDILVDLNLDDASKDEILERAILELQ